MDGSEQMLWDPTDARFLDIGNRDIDKDAADSIREAMHQLITEAELMLVWFAGLLRNLSVIRRDLESHAHLLDSQPLTFAMVDHEDYEYDGIRAMNLFVPKGRVLEAFSDGGDFEHLYGKAFVTFVYHIWDDSSRPAIARALGLKCKKGVEADLMGDWRHLRNWLVHQHQETEDAYFDDAKILTEALDLQRCQPKISAKMVFELVALLNVMQVRAVA